VQLDLRLWPGPDPNLRRTGIYEFEVAADALKAALQRISEPNERDNQRVEFELSDSSLHCAVKMKNGEFGAVAPVPLREQTKTGAAPVKFSIDALRIYRVSKFVPGWLAFEFNQDTAKLKISQVGGAFIGTIDVIPAPFEPADVDERSLGKIHSSDLRDGFRYASILSLRKSPPASHAGVRIAEGTVSSSYYRAASCFASPTLPVGLDFTVPKQFVAAARWVFGKFHGDIEVMETALRIRLRSPELEVYWTRGGSAKIQRISEERDFSHRRSRFDGSIRLSVHILLPLPCRKSAL
jgi:hypothetical protein